MLPQTNTRTALFLTGAVMVGCLVWWLSPAVYVSVNNVLPQRLQAGVAKQLSKVRKENARLHARLSQIQRSNRQLKIGISSQLATTSLPASQTAAAVIARPPTSPYDTLLVDVGAADGVHRGAAVWWPPGVYLGSIVDVRAHSSVVRLVSSAGVQHPGRIQNRLSISVVGRGGGMMTATVPATAAVATGTPVISDRFNAPIGQVVRTRSASAVGKSRLYIQPIIPASILTYVTIGS